MDETLLRQEMHQKGDRRKRIGNASQKETYEEKKRTETGLRISVKFSYK